jgi:hypothetical protein
MKWIFPVIAGLDAAIPHAEARPCHVIGIAGSSPAMTEFVGFEIAAR